MMELNIFGLGQKIRMTGMSINNIRRLAKYAGWLSLTSTFILLYSMMPARAYEANSTVNLNITGNIEEPVCEVSVKPSSAIDLGTVFYQRLTGKPGSSSDSTALSLVFDNCSTGTSSVTITFSGLSFDNTFKSIYVNEIIYGAKEVGLQLLSAQDQQSLGPNDRYTYVFNDSADGNVFNMLARMYTPTGRVAAGKVAFTVTFNVSYK